MNRKDFPKDSRRTKIVSVSLSALNLWEGSWKATFRYFERIGTMNLSGVRHRYGVPALAGESRSIRLPPSRRSGALAPREGGKAELHSKRGSWRVPFRFFECTGTLNRLV